MSSFKNWQGGSQMPDGLLDDVKDYLHISWVDVKTDKNITGMIKRGMAYLQKIAD